MSIDSGGKPPFILTSFRLDQGWSVEEFHLQYRVRFGDQKVSSTQQKKHLNGQVVPHKSTVANYMTLLNEHGCELTQVELTEMFRESRGLATSARNRVTGKERPVKFSRQPKSLGLRNVLRRAKRRLTKAARKMHQADVLLVETRMTLAGDAI